MTQNALFLAIAVLCSTCLYQYGCRSIKDTDVFFLDADNPLKDDEQDSLDDIDLRELAPHLRYGKEVAPHVRYGKEVAPHVRYGKEVAPHVRYGKEARQIADIDLHERYPDRIPGKDFAGHGHVNYGTTLYPDRIPGKDFAVRGKLLSDLASGTQVDDKAVRGRRMSALIKILRDVASESTKLHRKVSLNFFGFIPKGLPPFWPNKGVKPGLKRAKARTLGITLRNDSIFLRKRANGSFFILKI